MVDSSTLVLRATLAMGTLVLAAGCSKGDWGHNATEHRNATGSSFSYACPGGGALATVWGTGIYTDDSDVCSAAVHAGAITRASGGVVTIEMMAGQSSYCGSARNGVTSRDYGAWLGSYRFPAVGTLSCTSPPPPSSCTPACTGAARCVSWAGSYACASPCTSAAQCASGCCATLSDASTACAPASTFCSACRCPDGSACDAAGRCPTPATCHDRTACVTWNNTIRHGLVCGNWGEADADIRSSCADTVHCRFCYNGTFIGLPCGNFAGDVFTIPSGGHVGSGIGGVYACYESAPPTPGAGRYVCVAASDPPTCLPALH